MARANEPGRTGAGFGMNARPVGVYVIKDGTVRWRPAVDTNLVSRVALLGLAIAGTVAVRLFGRNRRVMAFRRRSPRRVVRAFFAR